MICLTPKLKQLRLSGMLATLTARERQAIDGQWSHVEFLSRLLEDEVERRGQKQLALRVRREALTSTKTLESFDWSFNPTINCQQVLHWASGDYIRRKHNLLLCGPSGVGKSHLAQALAHEACRQGFDVLFVNTHKLLRHLHGGCADGSWERRMARRRRAINSLTVSLLKRIVTFTGCLLVCLGLLQTRVYHTAPRPFSLHLPDSFSEDL